jgi:hypothetical protein
MLHGKGDKDQAAEKFMASIRYDATYAPPDDELGLYDQAEHKRSLPLLLGKASENFVGRGNDVSPPAANTDKEGEKKGEVVKTDSHGDRREDSSGEDSHTPAKDPPEDSRRQKREEKEKREEEKRQAKETENASIAHIEKEADELPGTPDARVSFVVAQANGAWKEGKLGKAEKLFWSAFCRKGVDPGDDSGNNRALAIADHAYGVFLLFEKDSPDINVQQSGLSRRIFSNAVAPGTPVSLLPAELGPRTRH